MNNLVRAYFGQLVGLMGNFNGIPTDDIMSRNGAMPSNITLESSIYPIASNCKTNKLTKKKINFI